MLVIELDHPNECVRSISGHIGQLGSLSGNPMCIKSLSFRTNRRRFGPYGTEDGTPFSFESNNSKIVGLFGSTADYIHSNHLHSIGAQVEALSEDQHPN